MGIVHVGIGHVGVGHVGIGHAGIGHVGEDHVSNGCVGVHVGLSKRLCRCSLHGTSWVTKQKTHRQTERHTGLCSCIEF